VLVVLLVLGLVVAQDADMQSVLDLHNRERQEVGVAAMQWDTTLAGVARQWAESCPSAGAGTRHSSPDYRFNAYVRAGGGQPPGGSIGENMAYGPEAAGKDGLGYASLWFDEKHDWNCATDQCVRSICGHYRQAVWADTTHLGCHLNRCSSNDILMVCMYAKWGNQMNERPFPADQCPAGGFTRRPAPPPRPIMSGQQGWQPADQPSEGGWGQPVGRPGMGGWQQPVEQPVEQWQPVGRPGMGGWQQPLEQPVEQWQPVGRPGMGGWQQPVQQPTWQQPVQQPTWQQPVQQPTWQQPVQQPTWQQPVQQPTWQQPVQQPMWQPVQQPMQGGWQPVQQPTQGGWQQPQMGGSEWQPVQQPMQGGWQQPQMGRGGLGGRILGGLRPGRWGAVAGESNNLAPVNNDASATPTIAVVAVVVAVVITVSLVVVAGVLVYRVRQQN